jgi:transposase
METVKRSTKFEVFVTEKYKDIIGSIRLYRALCRKAFTACAMAEMAGASISVKDDDLVVSPNGEASKNILKEAFGKDGKSHLYQLRTWIKSEEAPSLMSFVWDSLRKDVSSLWLARDPKIKATRGWLVLQGARGMALFQRRGIAFPSQQNPKLNQHNLTLKWDSVIGPVEFSLKKLDGGRYHVWKGLRDSLPDWKLNTLYLSEFNGKIFVTISYDCPIIKKDLDKSNVMEVVFSEDKENFITMKGPSNFDGELISAEEAMGILEQIKIRHDRWEKRRIAIGNPRRTWGSKKIWRATQEVVTKNSEHRTAVVQTRNHLWTRRIVDTAIRWNCGTIAIEKMPEGLFGEPWQWAQFKTFLKYKAEEIGVEFVSPTKG